MAPDELRLEDLLGELRGQGELDSQGRFTIDPEKARQRLAEFQLQDPYAYVLKLLQAAVAGGASAFHWRSGTSTASAEMPGLVFSVETLQSLLYQLIENKGHRAGRHLAIAINAAVRTRARVLRVHCWDGREGWSSRWTSEGASLSAWTPARKEQVASPFTRFEMDRSLRDRWTELSDKVWNRSVGGMLSGNRKDLDAEQALLHDNGSFCPIPITLNGRSCPGYELGEPEGSSGLLGWLVGRWKFHRPGYHLFEKYVPAESGPGIAPPQRSYSRHRWGPPQGHGWRYQRILAMPRRMEPPGLMVPIVDGVTGLALGLEWAGPSGIYYIDASEMDLDLTELELRQSQRNLRHGQALVRECIEACRDYLSLEPNAELQQALERGRGHEVRFQGPRTMGR